MQNYAVQSYRRQPARTDVLTGPSVRADAIYGASGSEFSAPPRVLSVARSRSSNAHLATGEQRVLRTLMFTDIVASTEHAAAVGDDCWRTIIRRYNAATHAVVTQFEGMVLKSLGDGHLVSLRCPTQAIFCARAVRSAAEDMNLKIRVGVHTGECELMDENDVAGLAVHIAARVTALADADEILVSSTVRDLVIGSLLRFDDRGMHTLRGIPGEWHLLAVLDA